jgi:hypothetical protein
MACQAGLNPGASIGPEVVQVPRALPELASRAEV